METRIAKAESNQNSGLVDYYEGKLKKLLSMRKHINSFLKDEKTKIHEVVICDDMFVEYPYYIKTKEGGIKEGSSRYWRAALKLHIKRKLERL
ncbi:hypothetical protein [Bacillus swezeyi]|uniref:Uncharacterized protein n=1 Tax=Bacillus swezeyi TaxID=1925020 RepID=A0A5M8RY12_9BACI|nr:hypothetical protein [Bacillus swezeyi]KAA6452739.1 hypothetical protein DX927_00490 [Bacillus swezeyi]TYS38104.1 hypothetical protein FZC77_00425 [Bacillus swezeyi]